jgi:hyperosmotically inducible protein
MAVTSRPMIVREQGRGTCACGCMPRWTLEEEGAYRGKGPAQLPSDQIKTEIERILTEDPWLDASGIQVSVQNGIAQLSGTVASRQAKRRAEDLTDQIWGVRDVQNQLSITGLQTA